MRSYENLSDDRLSPWLSLTELLPVLADAIYDKSEIAYNAKTWDAAQPPNFWQNNPAVLDWQQPLAEQIDEAKHLADLCRDLLLQPTALGSYVMSDDRAGLENAFAIAKALGTDLLRVRVPWYGAGDSYADLLRKLGKIINFCKDEAANGNSSLIRNSRQFYLPNCFGGHAILLKKP